MNAPTGTVIAVPAALGAAGSFGVAAALQHRGAQRAAGGTATFLAAAPPTAGRSDVPPRDRLLAFASVALGLTERGDSP